MRSFPIEALLRPAAEIQVGLTALFFSVLVFAFPHYFFLQPMAANVIAAGFFIVVVLKTHQSFRVLNYRRQLKSRIRWTIELKSLKSKFDSLLIGRGFEWQAKHVARLSDARSERGVRFLGVQSQAAMGGTPLLHGVGQCDTSQDTDIRLSSVSRSGNLLVLGTTGTGKSTALQYWSVQDIVRGDPVIIFDPKNDPDVLISAYQACVASGRANEFRMLHLGHPDGSDQYNPIGRFERVTEIANRVTGRMSNDGDSAAFREFAWVYVNTISRALAGIGAAIDYDSLLEHSRDLTGITALFLGKKAGKGFKSHFLRLSSLKRNELTAGARAGLREYPSEVIATVRAYRDSEPEQDPIAESLIRLLNVGPTHLEKLIQSLFPFLERLCTGPSAWLLQSAPVEGARTFDWESVIAEKGVVYIGLDALTDADVASAVGAAMFADLTSLAGKRYNEAAATGSPISQPIRIYADELSELLGKEFIQMVNKGRGAGLCITAFAQSLFDVESAIGNPAKARVVLENFNNLIMFRVRNEQTAAALTDGLSEVTIQTQMVVSSTQDNPNPDTDIDFTSSTQIRLGEQRVPLLSAADIKQLPRGECFADLEGGRIVKLRLPQIVRDAENLPQSLNAMVRDMRSRYRSSERWATFNYEVPAPPDA